MRSMLLAVLMLSCAMAAQAGEHETFGAGVPAGEAVPVSLAVKDLEAHAGEPRTFSGRITQVCQKEGCWAMLEDNGEAARVLMGDHDFYLPKDVRGAAEVHGVLSKVEFSPETLKRLAEAPGRSGPVPTFEYRIVAKGISVDADDAYTNGAQAGS